MKIQNSICSYRHVVVLTYTFTAVLLTALLSGCGDSSIAVRATRVGGITIDSSMLLAVGTITGDHAKGFRKNLTEALQKNGDFKILGVDTNKESAPDSTFKRIAASRAENHQSLIVITGTYTADKEEKTKTQGKDNYTGPSYTEKKVTGTFVYHIEDFSNHKVLLARSVERQMVERNGPDLKSLLKDFAATIGIAEDPMEQQVRKDVVKGFIGELYRHEEGFVVELYKDSDLPELETGISFATVGNWTNAIELFASATEKHPNHKNIHKAYYDLGVAYKCISRYGLARQNLEKAYVLKNNQSYFDEIQSVSEFEREDKMYEDQDQNIKHAR